MAAKVRVTKRHAEIRMFWHVPTDPQLSGFEGRDSKTTVRGRCVERVAKDTYCRILHSQASEHSGGKPPEKGNPPT